MSTIKHNINDTITVKLTKEGIDLLKQYWVSVFKHSPNLYTKNPPGLTGDTFVAQFWDLMQIFGPSTYMGGPQFFVDNIINIETPLPSTIAHCVPPSTLVVTGNIVANASKKKITYEDLAIEVCREEFMDSLYKAMSDSGGSVPDVSELKVHELCNVLAQNGVRFYYTPKTCSHVKASDIINKALEKINT
jgi:hypothetical protein